MTSSLQIFLLAIVLLIASDYSGRANGNVVGARQQTTYHALHGAKAIFSLADLEEEPDAQEAIKNLPGSTATCLPPLRSPFTSIASPRTIPNTTLHRCAVFIIQHKLRI